MSSHDHSLASPSHPSSPAEASAVAASPASQNTRRPRGRPRKHHRSSPSASTQSSSPSLRNDTSQTGLFAIKDIIDEKIVDGKLYYKIDWANDPRTGQVFEPSWEPKENANQEAVDDWEWEKQRRVYIGTTTPSSTGRDETPGLSYCSSPPVTICIDIPSKSDFLRERPEFANDSVLAITSSQLSDPHYPAAEIEVPATQFTGSSFQPIDDFVADSQSFLAEFNLQESGLYQQQPLPYPKSKSHFSQTTIPDSQAFSTDSSDFPSEIPETGQELVSREAASQRASYSHSSGFSIPSHQPDINQVSIDNRSVGFDLENQLFSEQDTAALPHHLDLDPQIAAQHSSLESSFQGFLTQPQYDFGEDSLDIASSLQPQEPPANLPSHSEDFLYSILETPLDDSHQPAQRVSPYPDSPSQFLTQPAVDLFSGSEDFDVVLDTSQRNSGQSSQPAQVHFEQPMTYGNCAASVTLHQTDLALIAALSGFSEY